MRQTASSFALLLVLSACGGAAATDTTEPASPPSTFPVSCPSGNLVMPGDGPDYLVVRNAYEAAGSGGVGDGRPLYLGSAVANIPQDLMVGLRYTGCTMLDGAAPFEQMAWSNGIGLLLVTWHEWPRTDDPSNLPFGGESAQRGVVEVSRLEQGTETTRVRIVHLFDGLKVVTAYTFALTTMSIDQVEEVAWAVYDGLPLDMRGAESVGATVQDALDAVRSDSITVSEPEPVDAMSAFTAILGVGHTSWSAVVDGTGVLLYDFGTPEVADRIAQSISLDGFSVAHLPYTWSGDPNFWVAGRVILLYQGTRTDLIELMTTVFGPAVGGGLPPEA